MKRVWAPLWLRVFLVGLALFAAAAFVLAITGKIHLVPSVLLLGAFLVHTTFAVFLYGAFAVMLHVAWNSSAAMPLYVLVVSVSLALFLRQLRQVRRAETTDLPVDPPLGTPSAVVAAGRAGR